MTKFEEELMATAKMIPTSDGNEIKFKTSSALYDYLLLSNGEAELYLQQHALPVVKDFVAEWIECVKEKDNNATALLTDLDNMPDDVNEWLFFQRSDDNINLILRAWLDGYTVEKPQLFKLIFPNSTAVLQKDGELNSFADTVYKRYLIENAMTEKEIKSIDERYWQFAVPVEDGE